MLIYQVEAHAGGLSRAQINQELGVVDDMLALAGGGVLCAEPTVRPEWINLFLRAGDEGCVADILEATEFSAGRITALGKAHETYVELGGWRTPQALARKRMLNYLLDHSPRHPPLSRHGHAPAHPAGRHDCPQPAASRKLKGQP